MRALLLLFPILLLAGCCEGEVARPVTAPAPRIPVPDRVSGPASPGMPLAAGADGVRGQSARALVAQFGQPRIDVQEGPARKLQFLGSACVLDVYLYPATRGREPVATHLDTRLRDGRPVDSTSCIATLQRRATP